MRRGSGKGSDFTSEILGNPLPEEFPPSHKATDGQAAGEGWYAYGMKTPAFTNMAVFVIFFGIALIEAIQKGNWIEATLFLALGLLSLKADFFKKQ